MNNFEDQRVAVDVLRERAYNLRWATLPPDVIPLTAADPDFPCAPEIVRAITNYSQKGYFSYGPAEGLPAFRESVATFFSEKRATNVNPDYVLPVNSAAFGIYLVCKSLLKAGDEAIIFDPVDFLFRYSIEAVGGKAIPFQLPPGTKTVAFDNLEKIITKKTKLLCLCNPLNPTGKVFTKEELAEFARIALKHGLTVLSDEIWSEIVYAPATFTSIASLSEAIKVNTVTVTGFSKSHGLAGLRTGVVIAHQQSMYNRLFEASMHQSTIHGTSVLAQVAATAALNECDYWLEAFVAHTRKMRDYLVSELNELPGFKCSIPDGCYVAFADIKGTNLTSEEVHNLLLEKAKVAVVPGLEKWFGEGARGHIRLCFSTSHAILQESIARIKSCFI